MAGELADAVGPRYRALVLLAAFGGLRFGELGGLRRRRVDLLHRTVTVAEILTEVNGRMDIGPPKTEAGRRTVVLSAFLVDELGPHCLRHSYVTHLIEDGYDGLFVQQQVGHAWRSTTALYTGVSTDFMNRVLRASLDRAFGRDKGEK